MEKFKKGVNVDADESDEQPNAIESDGETSD